MIASLIGLIDLYSPSISTYSPGYINVDNNVINPESQCSGVTSLEFKD